MTETVSRVYSIPEVASTVRQYLSDVHPDGVTLGVVEEDIKPIDYWWRVPVMPNVEPRRLLEYYDALAGVEMELEERESLKVILVPATPE